MNKLYKLYAEYTETRAAAWAIRDGLVEKGLTSSEIDTHPEYTAALVLAHDAFSDWKTERDKDD